MDNAQDEQRRPWTRGHFVSFACLGLVAAIISVNLQVYILQPHAYRFSEWTLIICLIYLLLALFSAAGGRLAWTAVAMLGTVPVALFLDGNSPADLLNPQAALLLYPGIPALVAYGALLLPDGKAD